MRYFFIICAIVFFIVFLMFLPLLISGWKYRHRNDKNKKESKESNTTEISIDPTSNKELKHIFNYYEIDASFREAGFIIDTRETLLEILKCETQKDLNKIREHLTDSFYAFMLEMPDRMFFDSCLTVLDNTIVGWYQDHGCDVIVAEYVVRILGESTRNKYKISMARPSRIIERYETDKLPPEKWKVLDVQIVDR